MDNKELTGSKRIFGVIAVFILLCGSLILIDYVSSTVLGGVRGYIYGEGQWTKAQKSATISLLAYLYKGDEEDYVEFESSLSVNEGDRQARETLSSENPDESIAFQGFLQGNNHPEDIDKMIWVFINFSEMEPIQRAITAWENGDDKIDELRALAEEIHNQRVIGDLSDEQIDDFHQQISSLEVELTELETAFSNAMLEAARWSDKTMSRFTVIVSLLFILLAGYISVTFMRSVEKSKKMLTESEERFKRVLDNSQDVIYEFDKTTGRYEYMSSAVERMLGCSSEEVLEGGPEYIMDRVHPDDKKRMLSVLAGLSEKEKAQDLSTDTEFRVRGADGKYIWVSNKRTPVKDENGNVLAVVGNVRDISGRKEQMERIDQSLKEKQTLLSEIHHRVKNNLAIVSSLIEMQKWEVDDERANLFSELQSRIKSIALVHEKLYSTSTFSDIELSVYIRELTQMISQSYRSNQREIAVDYDLDDMNVDIISAVPIGLICNELINNAFKHAFNNHDDGKIVITLKRKGRDTVLSILDTGGTLPDDFSVVDQTSLGMTLIKTLTKQLEGKVEAKSGEKETEFRIIFSLDD